MIWQVPRLGDKSRFLCRKKLRYSLRTSFPHSGEHPDGKEKNQVKAASRDCGLLVEKKERNVRSFIHFLALGSMANYLTSLCIGFFICKWTKQLYLPHRVVVRIKRVCTGQAQSMFSINVNYCYYWQKWGLQDFAKDCKIPS